MDQNFDPLTPRDRDMPTRAPLDPEADLELLDDAKIIAAPDDPGSWPTWRDRLSRWRRSARQRVHYCGSMYNDPAMAWTRTCTVISQIWLWDELLYDWNHHTFTPDRLLADAERFGGLDAVVLWHAYPVIGIDERNQWDYYRRTPGLTDLVHRFHRAGVRVFVDYNPWDTGTRRGQDDTAELTGLVTDLDADGVFLDTMSSGDINLVRALHDARPGTAPEGESTLPLTRLEDHPMSWAQWFEDSPVPGVIRSHWFERRHQLHHVRRWHRHHDEEIQSAWINGVGVMVWEVVFGSWVGWNDRDTSLLRILSRVRRNLAHLFVDGRWTPLVDLGSAAPAQGVYASQFTLGDESIVALVNRSDEDHAIEIPPHVVPTTSQQPVDITSGERLTDLRMTIPRRGIAGVWWPSTENPISWRPTPLSISESSAFPYRSATRLSAPHSGGTPPRDHLVVPAGPHTLTVRYRHRETGIYADAPFVDEWKPLPPRLHDQRTLERHVHLANPVAVQRLEVSRAEFCRFVQETEWSPIQPFAHTPWWSDQVPCCHPDEPATDVSLEDARAYAAFVEGRLPSEDEWQLAAAQQSFERRTPCVWNLTDSEHSDGRSRFMILKGGASFSAGGSTWYFDGGVRSPEFSAKYLVPGSGLSRASTIGFRCAWDLEVNEW